MHTVDMSHQFHPKTVLSVRYYDRIVRATVVLLTVIVSELSRKKLCFLYRVLDLVLESKEARIRHHKS